MVTNSLSTSLGWILLGSLGSGVTVELSRYIMIGPTSPALVSPASSTCEWYIHIMELPSFGPGPARAGTGHVKFTIAPFGMLSSLLFKPEVLSLYGAPSESFR